jgi:transcriptional regulator with XRE-family HTH domain
MLHPRLLIAARALAGWSQADLAAAANVGLRTVLGLESGARDTRYSNVLAIIDALRRHGVELAQGSERFVGGVLVVRGSPSDWLLEAPIGQDDDQSGSAQTSEDGNASGEAVGGSDVPAAAVIDVATEMEPEPEARKRPGKGPKER